MGGCATKPKVLKDDTQWKEKEPEPEPTKEDAVGVNVALAQANRKVGLAEEPQGGNNKPQLHEIVDDDQANKRRSLSLLFKENEDAKVSTNEKTALEGTKRQETLEAEKPSKDSKSNEPIVKQEPLFPVEKLSGESKNNEPVKQEYPVTEKKSSGQIQSNKTAEETVKPETSEAKKPSLESQSYEPAKETVKPEWEAEKPSKENQSNEPLKEKSREAKETPTKESQSIEPIKQAPLLVAKSSGITDEPLQAGKPIKEFENKPFEAEKSEPPVEGTIVAELVPLREEKVIQVVAPNAEPMQKITEEATSGRGDKNGTVMLLHASKVADAGSEKY